MQSKKIYLIRAIYQWCVEENLTPFLTSAVNSYVKVPKSYENDKEITLNISPKSVSKLLLNDNISFTSRFNGVMEQVFIPCEQVKGIFSKENGEGVFFKVNQDLTVNKKNIEIQKKPNLKLVK